MAIASAVLTKFCVWTKELDSQGPRNVVIWGPGHLKFTKKKVAAELLIVTLLDIFCCDIKNSLNLKS